MRETYKQINKNNLTQVSKATTNERSSFLLSRLQLHLTRLESAAGCGLSIPGPAALLLPLLLQLQMLRRDRSIVRAAEVNTFAHARQDHPPVLAALSRSADDELYSATWSFFVPIRSH